MLATHLTGDPQATYNTRQGIIPNQKINFRDLIPTVRSATGMYVTYRETGGSGEVGIQTEGELKNQLDYSFTEIKNVSHYVAGWVTFSKQLMLNLPWLQTTLTRLLLRDFYKKENAYFYSLVAANATGFTMPVEEENNVVGLIDLLMGRADADYSNSFILIKNSEKGEILKLLFQNGYYAGAGSVIGMPDGSVRIADVPVIGASFATAGKIMVIDFDFIERVETEGLRVEFSYENEDNFKRNLVTARVECFEDLNLLRPDAHTYTDSPSNTGSPS
jgi:HK97 family phage major capsid protein